MERASDELFKISIAIARVINEEAADVERKAVDEWIAISDENRQLFERLRNQDLLSRKMDIYRMMDKKAALQKFLKEKVKIDAQRKRYRIGRILKYVAIFILPLLIGGIYILRYLPSEQEKLVSLNEIAHGGMHAVLRLSDGSAIELKKENVVLSEQNGTMISSKDNGGLVYQKDTGNSISGLIYNTLEVPCKGEFYMQLSDGTKVWVGACSKLKYPVTFSGNTREIYLEGEAFFDVAKNPEKPFVVKTKDFSVRALGTSFNVMNYADDEFSHATLKTGKVEVTTNGQKVLLNPGEQAFYKDRQTSVKQVDVEVYTAWMGNSFKFDKESMEVILRKLARWYDIHIFYMNENLKKYHFKGTLPKYTDIHDVLNLLEQTTDIKFQIKGNTVIVTKDPTRSGN